MNPADPAISVEGRGLDLCARHVGPALRGPRVALMVGRRGAGSAFDGLRADVRGEGLAEQFNCGVPEFVRVSPVVDAAHAVLTGD